MIEINLLEIENNEEILNFRDSMDNPVWMFMRRPILYNIMQSKLLGADVLYSSRRNGADAFKYLLRSSLHNCIYYLFNSSDRPVMFYTGSRGEWLGGKFLNQYVDDIFLEYPEMSITIEHPPSNWNWIGKRINKDVIYNALNLSVSSCITRPNSLDRDSTAALLKFVVLRLQEIYGINLSRHEKDGLYKLTLRELCSMNAHAKWIRKVIKKYKSKLAVFIGNSYAKNYPVINALKQDGIITADLQHGFITKSNITYNYAEEIRTHADLKRGVPDIFLSYGEWWSEQTNIPFKKRYIIGNPYRDRKVARFLEGSSRSKIVLAGCANNTTEYLKMADYLSSSNLPYEIVFRPHPTERTTIFNLGVIKKCKFQIDMESDLYKLFEETEIIISEVSTVLFESIGLVPRHLVWRTDFSMYNMPDCPFDTFEGKEDILNKINAKGTDNCSVTAEKFWAANWKENLDSFLRNVLSK